MHRAWLRRLSLLVLLGPIAFVSRTLADGHDGTWLPVPMATPPDLGTRWGHTIVFDPVHQLFIAFGGTGPSGRLNDVWTHPLSGISFWQPLVTAGDPPAPRAGHSAVFDPSTNRMIVFGGDLGGGTYSNEVWQLDLLDDPPTWTRLFTAGTLPVGRTSHSAVFDPARRRMVVFGGLAPAATNDVYTLDFSTGLPTWQHTLPAGTLPSARYGHCAVFDGVHDRMVIYGGDNQSTGEVWSLSMTSPTWTLRSNAGGPYPTENRGALDALNNRMLVVRDALWSLDLTTFAWTGLSVGPRPDHHIYPGFTIDPSGHGVLQGGTGGFPRNDTWLLTTTGAPVWTEIIPQFPAYPPSPTIRYGGAGVYDSSRDRFLAIGGARPGVDPILLGDVARLQVGADSFWVDVLAATPFGNREAMGAVYDPVRDRVVVIGGYNLAFLNDVWLINAATLAVSAPAVTGAPPAKRDLLTATYDPIRDRIVVYGGNNGAALGDVWALKLSPSLAWAPITPAPGPAPPARMMHGAIYDPLGDRLIVFGGYDGSHTLNDVWALSLGGTPTWTQITPSGTPPSAREGFTFQYDPNRQRALLFGGIQIPAPETNDLWELTLGGQPPAWHPLSPGGTLPAPRRFHFGGYDPLLDCLVVSSGLIGVGGYDDIWRLQFSSDAPTATAVALLSHDVRSDEVVLNWGLSGDAATFARLERRDGSSDWRTIESGPVSGSFVTFHDRDVRAGGRYGYRLTAIAGAEASTSSEVWIDVPAGPNFSLASFSPNPATREGRVAFSLAERTPATIEVVDVGGRRVAMRRIESPAPGAQVIAIAPEGGLSPGLYFVRLTQGSRTATVRGTIVR